MQYFSCRDKQTVGVTMANHCQGWRKRGPPETIGLAIQYAYHCYGHTKLSIEFSADTSLCIIGVKTTCWLTVVHGFLGTRIILHIFSVHYDPELWDQPTEFRPERFIKNGKLVTPEYFLAFSAGRRSCIGEQLARKELFLFFANIMQSLSIVLPVGAKKPSLEMKDGVVMYPLPFDIEVRLRWRYSSISVVPKPTRETFAFKATGTCHQPNGILVPDSSRYFKSIPDSLCDCLMLPKRSKMSVY